MARAKNPESAKTPRTRKKKVTPANGNGHATSPDLESEIRVRAYEIYVQRGDASGSEFEDWLIAEKEVKSKRASAGA
jgi:Protein of unknown function (DUF2934)